MYFLLRSAGEEDNSLRYRMSCVGYNREFREKINKVASSIEPRNVLDILMSCFRPHKYVFLNRGKIPYYTVYSSFNQIGILVQPCMGALEFFKF